MIGGWEERVVAGAVCVIVRVRQRVAGAPMPVRTLHAGDGSVLPEAGAFAAHGPEARRHGTVRLPPTFTAQDGKAWSATSRPLPA